MKIDTKQLLKNADGDDLKIRLVDGVEVLGTVLVVLREALLRSDPNQKEPLGGAEQDRRYQLFKQVRAGELVLEDAKDVEYVKGLVAKVWPPLITGQIYDLMKI